MRAHDWAATPLGVPETWPQSLRAAVALMLRSRQAMFIGWGPEVTFLYNDAYPPILGPRHPEALGRPMARIWSDAWPQVSLLVGSAYAGEALWHEDLLVPLERYGYREDAYFTFSYTPLADDAGVVAGVFCAVIETTASVLAKQRMAFHVELEQRLRELSDPLEVVTAAEEALGRYLGARRVGYGVVDQAEGRVATMLSWSDGTVQPDAGTHDLTAVAPDLLSALRRGEALAIADSCSDPRTAAHGRLVPFGDPECHSSITVSLVKLGRMVAVLYVHDLAPRHWRDDEIELAMEVAERTWSALERVQAEADLRRANQHLQAEGRRLRELFRQAPGFMYVWRGADHVYEMANDAYFDLVGRRDIIGRPLREAFPDIDGQGFFELADHVFATGEPYVGHAMPVRLTRHPGGKAEERFVTFVMQPIRDADGRVAGIFVQGSDVTEARQAEEARRQSEERLRVAQEAGGIGTFELRGDGFLAVSPEFCRLWGIAPRPLVPLAELVELIHPQDRPRLTTLQGGRVPTDGMGYIEYRIIRPDEGEMRWIARRGQATTQATTGDSSTRAQEGEAGTRVLGVCYDITDRKSAEEALRELNATLEQRVAERTADRDRMWRLSTDIMLVARFDGVVTAVNPAWTSLLGWSAEDLEGAAFIDLVHPDDIEATRTEVGRLGAGLTTMRFENRYRHKDGSYRWISWTAVPDERFIHAVGRDVTARKDAAAALRRAEDQLRHAQKMEAVGQLTGGVAHDFNNLLQALSSCLTMIGRRSAEPRVKPLLEAGIQAVERGGKLVQQLMGFARSGSLRPEPIDLRDRVLAMSGLLERALRADIRLETRFAPGLRAIEVDPTQFELALINLAVNARDAMPDGGRLVIDAANVTLGPGTPPQPEAAGLEGDFVRLSVTDSGCGMPPDVLAKAFDPFFTTKEVGKGSGLGLAQVYGLARQAGGTVWIDSKPGAGTTITLLLRVSEDAPRASAAVDHAAAPLAGGARVLMVEDDPVVASAVAAALDDAGWTVLRASTADEALALLAAGVQIDLLFSDVVMPGRLNGVDLCREAVAARPGLPVVLTTGYSEDVARTEGIRLLSKPYRIDALLQALHETLLAAPPPTFPPPALPPALRESEAGAPGGG
ncbi:PAS domain S-box protein [Azospirillum picis]|uniref:histidine kinase n=1 Tax=Azospirillum picis TaxID=488438 RepID=A0ABU0MSW3_9PROT|nr:PAS domain S-box protein [Azospirillum picis]MBP2302761.1 PAS domain S-box-containing protein [Azospirillum picis]MDQ0536577.1 PAS domain S-box-containing protein [Azospirillum picis]